MKKNISLGSQSLDCNAIVGVHQIPFFFPTTGVFSGASKTFLRGVLTLSIVLFLLTFSGSAVKAQSMNMRIQFDTVFVNEEPAARIMIGEIRGNLVNIETYLLENKIKDNFKWYKVEFEHRLRKTLEMSSSFIQGKQIQIVYKNQSELTEVNDENRERITMNEGSVMDAENNIHAGEYLARAGRSYAVAIVVPIITTLFGALLFTTIGTTATFVVTGIGSIVGLVAHLDGSQNLVMAGKKFQRMDAK